MDETEYEDYIDESEDLTDSSQELQDAQIESYGTIPLSKEKSDLYTWFWKVVRLDEEPIPGEVVVPFKLSKVGNLNSEEIGWYGISMRDSMNLAYLGDLFHHKKFGAYWAARARINATTSMSKKGWFMDLSISQKKVRERHRSQWDKSKWRLFGKKDNKEQAGQ